MPEVVLSNADTAKLNLILTAGKQFLSVAYPNQDLLDVECLTDYIHVLKRNNLINRCRVST